MHPHTHPSAGRRGPPERPQARHRADPRLRCEPRTPRAGPPLRATTHCPSLVQQLTGHPPPPPPSATGSPPWPPAALPATLASGAEGGRDLPVRDRSPVGNCRLGVANLRLGGTAPPHRALARGAASAREVSARGAREDRRGARPPSGGLRNAGPAPATGGRDVTGERIYHYAVSNPCYSEYIRYNYTSLCPRQLMFKHGGRRAAQPLKLASAHSLWAAGPPHVGGGTPTGNAAVGAIRVAGLEVSTGGRDRHPQAG